MRTTLLLAAALVFFSACGGDGPLAPGRFTLEGAWEGRAFPYALELELRQDRDNRVTGTGRLHGLRERLQMDTVQQEPLVVDTLRDTLVSSTVDVDVTGEWGFPAVILGLSAPGTAPAIYAGAFVSRDNVPLPDSLAGQLAESGFAGVEMRLGRRTP
jgi:hypothetical protein